MLATQRKPAPSPVPPGPRPAKEPAARDGRAPVAFQLFAITETALSLLSKIGAAEAVLPALKALAAFAENFGLKALATALAGLATLFSGIAPASASEAPAGTGPPS